MAQTNGQWPAKPILVTRSDYRKLRNLLDSRGARSDGLKDLLNELQRAEIVDDESVPPDVVTMNSRFELRDLETGFLAEYTLVFPGDADFTRGRLSVLAPIGTALLGYRERDAIEWQVPVGRRRLRIGHVLYQPQASRLLQD